MSNNSLLSLMLRAWLLKVLWKFYSALNLNVFITHLWIRLLKTYSLRQVDETNRLTDKSKSHYESNVWQTRLWLVTINCVSLGTCFYHPMKSTVYFRACADDISTTFRFFRLIGCSRHSDDVKGLTVICFIGWVEPLEMFKTHICGSDVDVSDVSPQTNHE